MSLQLLKEGLATNSQEFILAIDFSYIISFGAFIQDMMEAKEK